MRNNVHQTQPKGLLAFGTNLATGSGILILGGYWIDKRSGAGHRWIFVGLALGFVYTIYEAWKMVRAISDKDDSSDGPSSGARSTRP